MALPLGRPLVVNVWLQSCQDCMPAFQAWHDIVEQKRLAPQLASASASVYNVAWGSADAAFAGRYHVDDNLVFDSGDALVKPLQITSFTTFVLDKDLRVRMRERPDSVGFAERLAGALQILGLDAAPAP